LTKKPVVPIEQEQLRNPRSRSAKMRAAQKL
jgi:16S rRNA (cytosine1402-N4)-methyltransferase